MSVQENGQMQIEKLMEIIRRRWPGIVIMTALGGALGFGLGSYLPQRYTARAQIAMDPVVRVIGGDIESRGDISETEMETHLALLSSYDHMRKIADELAHPGPGNETKRTHQPLPGADDLSIGLKAYQERKARVISVTYTDTDPYDAATYANHIAMSYIRMDGERRLRLNRQAFHGQQLDELSRMMTQLRRELANRDALLSKLSSIPSGQNGAEGFASALAMTTSDIFGGELARTRSLISALLTSRSAKGGGATDSGDVQKTDEELDRLRQQIIDLLKTERQMTTTRLKSLEKALAAVRGERAMIALSPNVDSLLGPARMVAESGHLITGGNPEPMLPADLEDATPLRLMTVAEPPLEPSSVRPVIFMLPGMLLFALTGGLLAVVREMTDQYIRTCSDVRARLGLACLGSVPVHRRLDVIGYEKLVQAGGSSHFVEAIRRFSISAMSVADNDRPSPEVLLLTSRKDHEGKSVLASAMSAYMAGIGQRVLLMDLSFDTPTQTRRHVRENLEHDVLDVLNGVDPTQVIRPAQTLGFDIMPLRHPHGDLVPSLLSTQFPALMGKLRQKYDRIIIDTSAIDKRSEVNLLAGYVDRIILVVASGHSTQRQMTDALLRVSGQGVTAGATQADLVGVVSLVPPRKYKQMPHA